MFYGRTTELNFLEDKYKNNKAELVVIYGRRRVGKTELLRYFSKDKPNIFYVCRECTDGEQIKLFSKKILKNSPMEKYIGSFKDWEDALRFIKEVNIVGKKLLIIDEFPYMVYDNNSIPSIIQNLWDEELKDQNIMIILCGSSMSFIEKEILSEKKPLYGRSTGIYKILEFDFLTSTNFFKNCSHEEKVINYAILGGVPHYLNQFEQNLSLEENIKKNILSKGCVLYNEVEFMMKQELRETATYYTIIEAVALGNTKINDIFTKTSIEKSKINVYLKNLIHLNIIEKEYTVTDSIKKKSNVNYGLYKIKNNYFKFYFKFIFPNISELEEGDIEGVYKYSIKPFINEYASFVFEDICIQYMRRLNIEDKTPFHFSKIGRWWDKKNEIDLVAFDNKNNLLCGECKWKNSKIGIKELNELKEKSVSIEGKYSNKYYYLFSKSGFNEELIKISQIDKSVILLMLPGI